MTNHKTAKILIVDDDKAHRIMLKTLIKGWGYKIIEADDGSVAIEMAEKESFDLILMDIKMAHVSGVEALIEIKKINPAIPIIIMTAYSSVDTAVETLRKGAYDYLTKPIDFEKLKNDIKKAMDHLTLQNENMLLKERLGEKFDSRNIIGRSRSMLEVMDTVAMAAPTDASILITGESGTGKEVIASAIHNNSLRKDGPFIKINCAAVTETLFESELFGHEKGSFTGASRKKDGSFTQADGGTLFLDEISEIPLSMQVKLLRVIQEREFMRVGGEKVLKTDIRIITATNRDLNKRVEEEHFREDLFYRLNVININIPPLKNRKDDIPLLAKHFIDRFNKSTGKAIKGIAPDTMNYIMGHTWPGNVRELMNFIERGVVLSQSDYLDLKHMPVVETKGKAKDSETEENTQVLPLSEIEKIAIIDTLKSADGNKSETARRLGITRKTLHKKLKSYGL